MVIDGHVHVFRAHASRNPRTVDELAPAEREAPVEQLLATMAAAGVDGAVLVPLGPEDEYVRNCVQLHPRRFVAIGVADAACTGRAAGTEPASALANRVAATGIRALRMNWLGDPAFPLRDSPAYPALRWMAAHGLVLWFYAPPNQLRLLEQAAAEFGDLAIVLNHLAFCPEHMTVDQHRRPRINVALPPPTLAPVLALARFPAVRVMVSGQYAFSAAAFPYADLDPVVRQLYEAFSASRLLWASDFPWPLQVPGYGQLLELPRRHLPALTPAERDAIFGGTVMDLFPGGWQE